MSPTDSEAAGVINAISDNVDSAVADRALGGNARTLNLGANRAMPLPASTWQLSALLQTTLDVEHVIRLFAHELRRHVPCDSFSYQHAAKGLNFTIGEAARHSASYRLLLEEQLLGEITVTRLQLFSESELMGIENYIGGLVYALRNALLYREAVESGLQDPLTGAANRAALESGLRREVGLSQRHGLPLSVLVLDIDKFKAINDTHGHAIGDIVLKDLVRTIGHCIRSTDTLARFGGEEFVVVLPGTSREGAALLARRICRQVEALRCTGAHGTADLSFTVSIGVAALEPEDDVARLLHRADQAMYRVKKLGGNQPGLA